MVSSYSQELPVVHSVAPHHRHVILCKVGSWTNYPRVCGYGVFEGGKKGTTFGRRLAYYSWFNFVW